MGDREGVPDFTDPAWQSGQSDAALLAIITEGAAGNPKMPAFGNRLDAEELRALVAYIRTLSTVPKKVKPSAVE